MTARRRPGATEPGRARHIPVLLSEVVASLRPVDGGTYIDATFGAGGYTRAILEAARCNVLALDRDPSAILAASSMRDEFGDRLTVLESRFSELDLVASEQGVTPVDGVVLDIGVSSMQLDQPERGFSFQADGPLDMRMSLVRAICGRHRQRDRGRRSRPHPLHARRGAPLTCHRAS